MTACTDYPPENWTQQLLARIPVARGNQRLASKSVVNGAQIKVPITKPLRKNITRHISDMYAFNPTIAHLDRGTG